MQRLPFIALISAVAALLATSHVSGQQKKDENPFLTKSPPSRWDARREIHIFASDFVHRGAGGNRQAFTDTMTFNSVKVVAPMIQGCATATLDIDRFETSLSFDHNDIDTEVELIPDLQCQEQVGVWEGSRLQGRKMALKIEGPVTTYGVKINERAANSVQWPTNGYPAEVANCLEPQLFIESDDPSVVGLMKKLTANNPQGPPPYMVAKALAGMVQEQFQPSGAGTITHQHGRFGAIEVDGAADAARKMKGSEPDMAALLCALYRAAGIPARIVVGWDVAGSPGGRAHVPAPNAVCRAIFDPDIASHAIMRTWVEFYLYDEPSQKGGWIPVDVFMLRQSSSRMGQLERLWDGFGGGMCFDHLVPITFHFVPPQTTIAAEDPALWGWQPDPAPQAIELELIFDAMTAVQRGKHR